ncbi:hypothetical protein MSIBF_A2070008 [groundwater metagenome]|uniref:Uncharacterized protein n=1 Tax=groundwater metagenome TaxID=717931 RepID=A0A098E9Q4_9ZZZZ
MFGENYNSKYNSKFYKISKLYANTGSEGGEGGVFNLYKNL